VTAERLLFARRFFARGVGVAALTPSSLALARAMTREIGGRPQVIVELGAGTGAVTAVAAERMHPGSRLVALEIDPALADVARREVPRAEVIVGDAAAVGELDLESVDGVLSGLPVPSLPRPVRDAVWAWLARYPHATFHQLTVMPWVYAGLYRSLFREVRFELVVRNLPPGGVYHCAGLR
jgi:phosphatidylethanolamine/phosphatidyl-N-methylethanolamine N-methyltransferase